MHAAVLCQADHPEQAEIVCWPTLLDLAQVWPAATHSATFLMSDIDLWHKLALLIGHQS